MKRALRCSLGLIYIAWSAGLAHGSGAAGSITPGISIQIHNYAQLDRKTLHEGEQVAEAIFRKAGLETNWQSATLPSVRKISAEQGPLSREIQLDLLPRSMTASLKVRDDALGLAPGIGPDRRLAYVFCDKVEDFAHQQLMEYFRGTVSHPASISQILGYVIAHEVGHVLLDLQSHSPTGIMRANWNIKDLQDAVYGSLLFTPAQAKAMQTEVVRRIGEQKRRGLGANDAGLTDTQ